jgi:hypothetical protein
MLFSLKQLYSLGLITITKTGMLTINCATLFVRSARYAMKSYKVDKVTKEIRIPLSSVHKAIAIELLCEQTIGLIVEVDPERSTNEDVKAMAGLASAPVPTKFMNPAPTRHTVPAPRA